MVIEYHPKMVQMWINRCNEVRRQKGIVNRNIWMRKMFTDEDIQRMNELITRKRTNGKGSD